MCGTVGKFSVAGTRPNAKPGGREHRERAGELGSVFEHCRRDHVRALRRREFVQADEENSGRELPEPKHQLTEILVHGDEKCPKGIGLLEHTFVRNAWGDFRDVVSFETLGAEAFDDLPVHAFVPIEPHAAMPGAGYTTSERSACAAKDSAALTPSRVSRG